MYSTPRDGDRDTPPSWQQLQDSGEYASNLTDDNAHALAAAARTDVTSVRSFGTGWANGLKSYTLPLYTGERSHCGQCYFQLTGITKIRGRAGLLIPPQLKTGDFGGTSVMPITTDAVDWLALCSRYPTIGVVPSPLDAVEALNATNIKPLVFLAASLEAVSRHPLPPMSFAEMLDTIDWAEVITGVRDDGSEVVA